MPKNITPFIQGIVAELHSRFSELYGDRLVHLVLYGSQARGEAEPGSDIDVLVVLRGPVDAGLEIARTGEVVAALSLYHDVAIACVFMEEERYLHRQGPFLRNVRREGIVL
jgi:predicted nucleotidyltransferase